jgi:hypothetical protein
LYGSSFDVLQAIGDAHDHPRLYKGAGSQRAFNAASQEGFDEVEVDDDAVFDGVNGIDVFGRTPNHLFGVVSHSDHALRSAQSFHSDDGWFIHDDALASNHNQCVRSAQVDCDVW